MKRNLVFFVLPLLIVGCTEIKEEMAIAKEDVDITSKCDNAARLDCHDTKSTITYPYSIDDDGVRFGDSYYVVYMDGCEYICSDRGRSGVANIVHKGNCRFCEQRRIEREMRE